MEKKVVDITSSISMKVIKDFQKDFLMSFKSYDILKQNALKEKKTKKKKASDEPSLLEQIIHYF